MRAFRPSSLIIFLGSTKHNDIQDSTRNASFRQTQSAHKFFTATSPTQSRLGQRFRLIKVVIAQCEIDVRAHCSVLVARNRRSRPEVLYSHSATTIILYRRADILYAIEFRRWVSYKSAGRIVDFRPLNWAAATIYNGSLLQS